MSYLHIPNLYRSTEILLFKECYALEKIHGTSAHIRWDGTTVSFFAGGCDHESFVKLFDADALAAKFAGTTPPAVICGEAYGGKMQGMSATYGKQLKFVAFEVRIGEHWLDVPQATDFVKSFGLEFVDWVRIPATIEAIDAARDAPSVQSARNGIEGPKLREGVVLRPLIELRKNNGERIIAKHKNDAFRETKTPRPLDAGKLAVLTDARAIADEWVTEMRLSSVLNSMGGDLGIDSTGRVIIAMMANLEREAAGEVELSHDARKAVGKRTAQMFKARLQSALHQGDM